MLPFPRFPRGAAGRCAAALLPALLALGGCMSVDGEPQRRPGPQGSAGERADDTGIGSSSVAGGEGGLPGGAGPLPGVPGVRGAGSEEDRRSPSGSDEGTGTADPGAGREPDDGKHSGGGGSRPSDRPGKPGKPGSPKPDAPGPTVSEPPAPDPEPEPEPDPTTPPASDAPGEGTGGESGGGGGDQSP
ncbi:MULTISPECIES: hypothetical protein [Streptomyces]|uniref:hypothetical protein n=1 Tax=Streptomyces TaxID=1883 RepID=UPI0022AA0C55|nr:hypothetical protein [Streptomyces sp. HB2AG]MCZ2523827.1 hypothetical protein [Streptomyces sp. HB2AG]